MEEPILQHNPDRFVIYPIVHDDLWKEFKRQEASFWTAEEIDLAEDRNDWLKLKEDERHFIKHVLAFFAASLYRDWENDKPDRKSTRLNSSHRL